MPAKGIPARAVLAGGIRGVRAPLTSDLHKTRYVIPVVYEPAPVNPSLGAAQVCKDTVDECIAILEKAGEHCAVQTLRREFDHWPANHEHMWSDDGADVCVECGATR